MNRQRELDFDVNARENRENKRRRVGEGARYSGGMRKNAPPKSHVTYSGDISSKVSHAQGTATIRRRFIRLSREKREGKEESRRLSKRILNSLNSATPPKNGESYFRTSSGLRLRERKRGRESNYSVHTVDKLFLSVSLSLSLSLSFFHFSHCRSYVCTYNIQIVVRSTTKL